MRKIEKTYFEHQDLIKQKALKFHCSHKSLELEEIESECNLAFMSCYKKYDPDKASFKTYLNNVLEFTLMEVSQGLSQLPFPKEHIRAVFHHDMDAGLNFNDWKNSLSSEAKKIIRAIFKAPLDEISSEKTKRITQGALKNYLRRNNWKCLHIDFYFNEIKKSLKFCH